MSGATSRSTPRELLRANIKGFISRKLKTFKSHSSLVYGGIWWYMVYMPTARTEWNRSINLESGPDKMKSDHHGHVSQTELEDYFPKLCARQHFPGPVTPNDIRQQLMWSHFPAPRLSPPDFHNKAFCSPQTRNLLQKLNIINFSTPSLPPSWLLYRGWTN